MENELEGFIDHNWDSILFSWFGRNEGRVATVTSSTALSFFGTKTSVKKNGCVTVCPSATIISLEADHLRQKSYVRKCISTEIISAKIIHRLTYVEPVTSTSNLFVSTRSRRENRGN